MPIYSLKGNATDEVAIVEADEGDAVRRLRLKNRRLEQEFARLMSAREEPYAKRVADAEERCQRMLSEKDRAHAAYKEKQERDLDQTRAGATIMCSLFVSKKNKLQAKLKADKAEAEQRDAAARERYEQLHAEHVSTTQSLQQKLSRTISDYEATLARLRSEHEERERQLERQLAASRDEAQRLRETCARQRRENEELQSQLQRQVAENERLEGLVAAPRALIKEMQKRARLQQESLEKEIGDYVKYIVATRPSEADPPVPPRTPAARSWTAARPPTPTSPLRAQRPLQLPASARGPAYGALPPVGDETYAGGGTQGWPGGHAGHSLHTWPGPKPLT